MLFRIAPDSFHPTTLECQRIGLCFLCSRVYIQLFPNQIFSNNLCHKQPATKGDMEFSDRTWWSSFLFHLHIFLFSYFLFEYVSKFFLPEQHFPHRSPRDKRQQTHRYQSVFHYWYVCIYIAGPRISAIIQKSVIVFSWHPNVCIIIPRNKSMMANSPQQCSIGKVIPKTFSFT